MAGTSLRVRLTLLGMSSLVSACAVVLVLRALDRPRDTVRAHFIDPAKVVRVHDTLDALAATISLRPARPVTAEEAASFFPQISGFQIYDALAYFRYKPHLDLTAKFPEHPDGVTKMRTNSFGFKALREVRKQHPALRVIITGDSHVDGVVGLNETCSERLYTLLQKERPKHTTEVINAAVGGYSLYNYYGALERCAPLAPDVFITCVFGGNDFDGALFMHSVYAGWKYPPNTSGLSGELDLAAAECPGVRHQGLTAGYYFHRFPDQAAVAFDTVRAMTHAIRAKCDELGAAALFVYVPPVHDVQWWTREAEFEAACSALGVAREDLHSTDRIADRWIQWMASETIPHVDLRTTFRAAKETLYWRTDGHINARAHELMAGELAPVVRELRPRRSKFAGQRLDEFEVELPPQPRGTTDAIVDHKMQAR